MKRYVLMVSFLCLINYQSQAQWISSYDDAQKLAIATNKLILIDFWATWCGPCRMMDADTWSNKEVKESMTNFVPLKIDIDSNRNIASKYSANRIPYVVIIDANGEVLYEESGYKDKNRMLAVLKNYSVNMKGFQDDFVNYRNNKKSDSAIKIGEKYFDYALYVDHAIKSDFLSLGNYYLKKAKKLSDKQEFKNKYQERVGLLSDGYYNLIRGKYEKVIKKLDESFKEESIKDENKGLYNFLYFTAYNKLNDKTNARSWYDKLKTDKNAKIYLLKSRKL